MSDADMREEREEVKAKVRVMANAGRVAIIRRLLLEISEDERVDVLYKAGFCGDCGTDLFVTEGARNVCHCMNDE